MKSVVSSVIHLCFICGCLCLSIAVGEDEATREKVPDGLRVVSIEARPESLALKHKFDYRQLLVTGKLETGETVDLTRLAKATVKGSAVTVSDDGLVRAKED